MASVVEDVGWGNSESDSRAAAKIWVALTARFGESPADVLELIVRDHPLLPARENAKCGEFTQVGDLLLTAREVALAQPAAHAATSTNHAERVRLTFGTDRQLDMQFSGAQRLKLVLFYARN